MVRSLFAHTFQRVIWLLVTAWVSPVVVNSFIARNLPRTRSLKMPPNQDLGRLSDVALLSRLQDLSVETTEPDRNDTRLRCAVLGCGMMGQEHVSYISGYPKDLKIDFLCDPHQPSIEKCSQVLEKFSQKEQQKGLPPIQQPAFLASEQELLEHVHQIDLLVIASPNYLHTDTLLRWGRHDITILLEKPVAVSPEQHAASTQALPCLKARVWVAMEYRFIPAIAKLIQLLPSIGDIQMCTIRENRFPFLHKIGKWNRDKNKTGDTLVEKCCHFFDLMRLITGQEANLDHVRAIAQRGINYQEEEDQQPEPIIDAAYVFMSFLKGQNETGNQPNTKTKTMGCLELCMYADGSRHQEEIVVTGTHGRLEAYLPENKVFQYERPSHKEWQDRSIPPPIKKETIHDCSDAKAVHNIGQDETLPSHGGYHYSSTAVEWYRLLGAIRSYEQTGTWEPQVSLLDGLKAVEMGLKATEEIVNET